MATTPRKVRKKITPRHGWSNYLLALVRRDEVTVTRRSLEQVTGEVPTTPYTVEYTLHREGEYVFQSRGRGVIYKGEKYASVCFLPKQWDGKRVNREVVSE